MNLRPAKEVREEIDSKRTNSRQKSIERQIADISKKIEENKPKGWVSSLTVMPEVEQALMEAGYIIDHSTAAHCGDMDSITIKW